MKGYQKFVSSSLIQKNVQIHLFMITTQIPILYKKTQTFFLGGSNGDTLQGKYTNVTFYCQGNEILDWCPAGSVLPHGEKVPL